MQCTCRALLWCDVTLVELINYITPSTEGPGCLHISPAQGIYGPCTFFAYPGPVRVNKIAAAAASICTVTDPDAHTDTHTRRPNTALPLSDAKTQNTMLRSAMKAAKSLHRVPAAGARAASSSAAGAAGRRVAVVLSGNGVYDGSETTEATAALVHLSRGGAQVSCFAPDKDQMHAVDHTCGEEHAENRNVLKESARIARQHPGSDGSCRGL